ncbi:Uncharacterised protein [Vibrio cholerae]|nr:Uncharacterised protein [Vibrio cholerae]
MLLSKWRIKTGVSFLKCHVKVSCKMPNNWTFYLQNNLSAAFVVN